ncbi:MAG: hypothetical protein ACI9DC_001728 [Gammaproteobacteria bacterium]|jgi:hypothetical protein
MLKTAKFVALAFFAIHVLLSGGTFGVLHALVVACLFVADENNGQPGTWLL